MARKTKAQKEQDELAKEGWEELMQLRKELRGTTRKAEKCMKCDSKKGVKAYSVSPMLPLSFDYLCENCKPDWANNIINLKAELAEDSKLIQGLNAENCHLIKIQDELKQELINRDKQLKKFKANWQKRFDKFNKKQNEVVHKQQAELAKEKKRFRWLASREGFTITKVRGIEHRGWCGATDKIGDSLIYKTKEEAIQSWFSASEEAIKNE